MARMGTYSTQGGIETETVMPRMPQMVIPATTMSGPRRHIMTRPSLNTISTWAIVVTALYFAAHWIGAWLR